MAKQRIKSDGPTVPSQFRLTTKTMSDLDAVAGEYGLSSRAEAIRFLARKEAKRILEKGPKSD